MNAADLNGFNNEEVLAQIGALFCRVASIFEIGTGIYAESLKNWKRYAKFLEDAVRHSYGEEVI